MKKGLLLSVVASTMIFAGGDIAPVEPAAPASADFWGQIGFSYDFNDWDVPGKTSFTDKDNNTFSTAVVLGVEKELAYGFGFGAEVAGWTDFGLDIANGSRVGVPVIMDYNAGDPTHAEVSQAYLTYTFGNTAIKAGRQALPKAVSPWAWSDRTVGVIDVAYDAIVIANTDIANTTLVGAWVANAVEGNSPTHIGAGNTGIFMLAVVNKSLANTTLTASGYYFPKANFDLPNGGYLPGNAADMWSIWGSAVTNFDSVTVGLQAAYVDGDNVGTGKTPIPVIGSKQNATYAIAGKIGSSWGDFDATLVAAYVNDGSYSLKTAGSTVGTSAFWGNSFGGFFDNGDVLKGYDKTTVRVDANYKLSVGKLYGGIGYANYGSGYKYNDGFGGRVGYAFPIMNTGVNGKVEYRYANYNGNGTTDKTLQRVRVEASYKF